MIIDWKDYVDHIFSVTCTNNIKQIDNIVYSVITN